MLYVIILSAALDLVGPTLPKAIVLLADVMPSVFVKLLAPYAIHRVPYPIRVWLLVVLSFVGMQLVAWQTTLLARLFGVMLASVASGLGELSFLGLTHYYGPFAIPFWGSGTGAAGLLGAGLYVCATSLLGLSVRASIMAFGFLPLIMLLAFFSILPLAPLKVAPNGYRPLAGADADTTTSSSSSSVGYTDAGEGDGPGEQEEGRLLAVPMPPPARHTFAARGHPRLRHHWRHNLSVKLRRTRKLFFP